MNGVALVFLAAAVGAVLGLLADALVVRARRRALREVADDYSVNLGLMTPFEIRAWIRDHRSAR